MMRARPTLALPALLLGCAAAASAPGRDAHIEASARRSYNFRVHLKGDAIQVKAADGVATLTGTVANEMHRDLAEATLRDTPGVRSVVNLLTLAEPGEAVDARLAGKVQAALRYQRNIEAATLRVEARDGTVTLTGEASSAAQKALAEEVARDVEGVQEVENRIRVDTHPGPRPLPQRLDDASITGLVKASLLFHRGTHLLTTRVTTRRGIVTLRGEARNGAEKELAARIASGVHGVVRVDNRMTLAK